MFSNTEKKSPFSKISGYVWTGSKSSASKKQPVNRTPKEPYRPKKKTKPTCIVDTPTSVCSKTSAKKQIISHVVSDDEIDSDEAVQITTSCDNVDCKALKIQRRLDVASN